MQLINQRVKEVETACETILAKTRDWQMIQKYLSAKSGTITLTGTQKKKLEKYQFIYNQMVSQRFTNTEVVNMVVNTYRVDISQAYEDLRSTKEVFAFDVNFNKRFELHLQLENNRRMLRKAEEVSDMKAYAALEKNRALLLKLLPDEETADYPLFEGHTIEAVFDPSLLGAPKITKTQMVELLSRINEKRQKKIDLNKFMQDLPDLDTVFEEG